MYVFAFFGCSFSLKRRTSLLFDFFFVIKPHKSRIKYDTYVRVCFLSRQNSRMNIVYIVYIYILYILYIYILYIFYIYIYCIYCIYIYCIYIYILYIKTLEQIW